MNSIVLETAARSVQARRRIRPHIFETPLLPSRQIGRETGSSVYFKAENFQLTGSFKIRGAASKMTSLGLDRGVITASSGNHGIATAQAASSIGQVLTVVLPETVSQAKLERIRSFNVNVILHGAESGLAELHAQQEAASHGLVYVSPYNDPEVVAGQGSIGLELLEQADSIDNVFVSMGGGGLIGGIGSVLKSFSLRTRIFGVAAQNSAALAAAIEAGRVVETEHLDTLADGVAGGMDEDSITLPLALSVIDGVVACTEAEIAGALRDLAFKENQIVEGAAALALAGFLKVAERCRGQTNIVVLCGANFDREKIFSILND
ncbi:pyridoxal-phosphate dependent enzyme [Microvirga terrae]|uniref:Pyridoxal-phosphate dependent enzyme n=1 Tax=Microvirga terrae TaxID=2740529 RepID=A0ABY5RZ52_9HYPH|nr:MULTISPECIES: pyridoxal-phosphate dependent enzyme [Microvirga]MBQ0823881.1 pyridoxal-phosphate dependent enzyme [Microvirga sp. HBU67558]UVF21067.1 pyridoxal-phosphate dependent enzyme [Microvirga terrae]